MRIVMGIWANVEYSQSGGNLRLPKLVNRQKQGSSSFVSCLSSGLDGPSRLLAKKTSV
jgi:hypothetical protein